MMDRLEMFNLVNSNDYVKETFNILTRDLKLTEKLRTIFNKHFDALYEDLKETLENPSVENGNDLLDYAIEYLEEYMIYPYSSNNTDFIIQFLELNSARHENTTLLDHLFETLPEDLRPTKVDMAIDNLPHFKTLKYPALLVIETYGDKGETKIKPIYDFEVEKYSKVIDKEPWISTPKFKIWFNL